MPFPNFIIGGPPKCGTTSLYAWLSDHPDVCVSSVKEPYFFQPHDDWECSDEEREEYSQFFNHHAGEKIILEATPSNIYSESARNTLFQLNPDLKVLFVLRHPADRLYSEYAFHKFKTHRFGGDFSDYIDPFHFKESDYAFYINEWNATFGKAQVALVTFEDLKTNPQLLMQALCGFLDIDPTPYKHYSFDAKNKTMVLHNRGIHMWLLKWAKKLPLSWVKKVSPLYYTINSEATPPMTEHDKLELDRLRSLYAHTLPGIRKKFASQFILKDINS